jgi:hypothetical protein
MNDEIVICHISNYIDEELREPQADWSEEEFRIQSYSRWAANEILDRIIKEASKLPYHISGKELIPPVQIIVEFVDEMDYYADLNNEETFTGIERFSVAREAAKELLLWVLYSVYGKEKKCVDQIYQTSLQGCEQQ